MQTRSFERRIAVLLLIAAMAFSPRIPIPIAVPGRRFDLRVQDIILVAVLSFWLLYLFVRPRIYLTELFTSFGIYTAIVVLTSAIAMMTLELSSIRTVLYFSKEVEYFLVFLFVANWIASEPDLRLASFFLLVTGSLNAVWIGLQIVTSQFRPLFLVRAELPSGVPHYTNLLDSYGPHLMGEASPLATGGFFMLITLLSMAFFVFSQGIYRRCLYGALCVTFFAALAASFSRVALLSTGIGITLLFILINLKKKFKLICLLLIVLTVALLVASDLGFLVAKGRVSLAGLERRIVEQAQEIWQPLLHEVFDRIFLGYGKGSLGYLGALKATEAHNHYLRVLIESGLLGLIAFLWLLVMIIFVSARVLKKSQLRISRIVSSATLCATAGLCVGALFHDVFVPVTLNENWWVLIGLTAAAHKIENKVLQYE